jgi:chemotaxis protein methyltransferase CheR
MELSPLAIRVMRELLETRTGQQLAENRLWRVETALKPVLQANNIETTEQLAMMVAGGRNPLLGDTVAEALLNHESFFFRDPPAFDLLIETISGPLRTARMIERRLRIWSAGCSTGQEVYSLAMSFAERPDLWGGWMIEIMGTDVSRDAIARARAGVYNQFEIQRGLPVRRMLRWFETKGEEWHAIAELKRDVNLHVHNLLDRPPPGRAFDVILCRNVLLYFPQNVREGVFDRFSGAIAPDGILMLGAGETVLGQTRLFEANPDARGLYRSVKGSGLRAA